MSEPMSIALLIVASILILALLGVTVYYTIKFVKNGKIAELRAAIEEAILEAEKTHAEGAEKKEMVIKAITAYCEKIGIKVNEKLIAWAADYIDAYIAKHNNLEAAKEQKPETKKAKGRKNRKGE